MGSCFKYSCRKCLLCAIERGMKMVKLSELQDDVKVIDENLSIYDVEEVKNDLQYFKDKNTKLYTTNEYHASIDARDMLESAIESEYDNMYEDWYEIILQDITDEDIGRLQSVIATILRRGGDQNIAYYEGKEIEIDI